MSARQKNSPAKARREENRRIAFELRKAGATFDEIGKAMGMTRQSAFELVTKTLAEIRSRTAEDVEHVRELELHRLDALLKGLWQSASKGSVNAVDRALKIMERRARLLGLDAPTKLASTNPAGDEERPPYAFPVPPQPDLAQWQEFAARAAKDAQDNG